MRRQSTFWELEDGAARCRIHFGRHRERRFVPGEFAAYELVAPRLRIEEI